MGGMRKALRQGDRTSTGGVLRCIGGHEHGGIGLAAEGDVASCPACKVPGVVRNDCHPSVDLGGRQILVQGARVQCRCPVKPIVMASQTTFEIEVDRGGEGAATPSGSNPTEASNKLVAELQEEQFSKDTALICPNMSNDEFFATMRLRDKAVRLIEDRLVELERWNGNDRAKLVLWFGDDSRRARQILRDRLKRIYALMRSLVEDNFVRHSTESLAKAGCVPRAKAGDEPAAASVCKPDQSHRIFIGRKFCNLPDELNTLEGRPIGKDSKLLVLVHEVSHFVSTMATDDPWYSVFLAKRHAAARDTSCLSTADNIASYVLNISKDD